ncbi:uncharacterized protein [Euwallacea fornicatus]|uniref:uncharacterized protein n=1 Tax=Euwallacea fornicatus TaxID=995702 RepID=UPI00338DA7DE
MKEVGDALKSHKFQLNLLIFKSEASVGRQRKVVGQYGLRTCKNTSMDDGSIRPARRESGLRREGINWQRQLPGLDGTAGSREAADGLGCRFTLKSLIGDVAAVATVVVTQRLLPSIFRQKIIRVEARFLYRAFPDDCTTRISWAKKTF